MLLSGKAGQRQLPPCLCSEWCDTRPVLQRTIGVYRGTGWTGRAPQSWVSETTASLRPRQARLVKMAN